MYTIESAQQTQKAARAFLKAGGNYCQRQNAISKLRAVQGFLTSHLIKQWKKL